MQKMMYTLSAAAILIGTGLATAANADASSMTCGEFGMMSDADRLTAAHDTLLWINDTANFETATAALTGRYDNMATDGAETTVDSLQHDPDNAWTNDEMKIEIEGHCINMPLASKVVERLQNNL